MKTESGYVPPSEYLTNHDESVVARENSTSLIGVNEQIILKNETEKDIVYQLPDGRLTASLNKEIGEENRAIIEALKQKLLKESFASNFKRFFGSDYYKLENLVLSKKQIPEKQIDLKEILPENVEVIINPVNINYKERPCNEVMNFRNNAGDIVKALIFIEGQPNDLGTVLRLMHEIGHVYDRKSRDDHDAQSGYKELSKIFSFMTEKEAAAVLLCERNAWAFALKILKPLINNENRQLILDIVHKEALGRYTSNLRLRVPSIWFRSLVSSIDNLLKDN
jgi:hypothetical protein